MITLFKHIISAFAWFFTVAPWEQAIRVRFGKHVRLLGAGFYYRIPFADRVFKQSVRRRLMNIRPQTLTTKDGRVVTCTGTLGYSIDDIKKLYETLESAQGTLENDAAAALARFVGCHDFADCQHAAIENAVREALDFSKYGLTGTEFRLISFASVRTYRFITGDLPSWDHGHALATTEEPAR